MLPEDDSPSQDSRRSIRRVAGQRLICITAAQRAGTTALQHALKAAGVTNFGEVFHPEPLKEARGTFLSFAQQNDLRLSDTITSSGTAGIAERYLSWLRDAAAPAHLLIDVKLNSWFALSPWWQYSQSEPLFLASLKRERAVMIFIWRENLAEQVLSQFIAVELGIWHNLTPERSAGRTLKAPVDRMKRLATLVARSEIDMLNHLQSYSTKVVIRYEDLFQDGVLSEKFRRAFIPVAGINLPENAAIGLRRNSLSKKKIVENYEEIVAAIRPISESRRQGWDSRNID